MPVTWRYMKTEGFCTPILLQLTSSRRGNLGFGRCCIKGLEARVYKGFAFVEHSLNRPLGCSIRPVVQTPFPPIRADPGGSPAPEPSVGGSGLQPHVPFNRNNSIHSRLEREP